MKKHDQPATDKTPANRAARNAGNRKKSLYLHRTSASTPAKITRSYDAGFKATPAYR